MPNLAVDLAAWCGGAELPANVADEAGQVAKRFLATFSANDGLYEAAAGSNVMVDRINSGRSFAAGTGTIPAAVADGGFGGKPVLTTDGSTNFLISNQAASFWKALHSPTGGTVIFVHQVLSGDANNRALFATSDIDGAQVGIVTADAVTTSGFLAFVLDGTNVTVPLNTGALPHVATPSYVDLSIASGTNGLVVRRKSSTIFTATSSTLSSANPQTTMCIGTVPSDNPTVRGNLKVRALYHWNRVLSASDRATVQSYIFNDTSITP